MLRKAGSKEKQGESSIDYGKTLSRPCRWECVKMSSPLFFDTSDSTLTSFPEIRTWRFERRHGSIKIYRKDIKHWFMYCGWARCCLFSFSSWTQKLKLFSVVIFCLDEKTFLFHLILPASRFEPIFASTSSDPLRGTKSDWKKNGNCFWSLAKGKSWWLGWK